jgi:hypothetical protein
LKKYIFFCDFCPFLGVLPPEGGKGTGKQALKNRENGTILKKGVAAMPEKISGGGEFGLSSYAQA